MDSLEFRVWDNILEKFDDVIYKAGEAFGHPSSGDWEPQQYIGIKDINGKKIFVGDIIVEYPDNQVYTQEKNNIYVVDYDQPRTPLKDIIINRGVVKFSFPSFQLEYDKVKDTGACSCTMQCDGNYEVVGNIYENLK